MTDTKSGPRKWLLTQNRQLRQEGIFNWPLPAFAGRFDDGRTYNTCPEAGACAVVLRPDRYVPISQCARRP